IPSKPHASFTSFYLLLRCIKKTKYFYQYAANQIEPFSFQPFFRIQAQIQAQLSAISMHAYTGGLGCLQTQAMLHPQAK
ncbi:MAG: hypothetical protein ACLUKN_10230, partial [Bacilli bacterium]